MPHRTFTLPADDLIHGTTRAPQISPDGRKVVYSSLGPGRLWVRDLATSESRAILDAEARFYSWSPHSTQIVYISSDNAARCRTARGCSTSSIGPIEG